MVTEGMPLERKRARRSGGQQKPRSHLVTREKESTKAQFDFRMIARIMTRKNNDKS